MDKMDILLENIPAGPIFPMHEIRPSIDPKRTIEAVVSLFERSLSSLPEAIFWTNRGDNLTHLERWT
jgi:hypothetical protein